MLLKFLEINVVSRRVQIYLWIICFRTSSDCAEIYHCALGYWDLLIKEGTTCSMQLNYISHQWNIIVFSKNIVFQVEFVSATCRYLEAGCLRIASQVYSNGKRDRTAKHFQLIWLGCLFQGEMNCPHIMPDSFCWLWQKATRLKKLDDRRVKFV